MRPKTDDYYKKYRYLIWRGDVGFLHLESFSLSDLKIFSENLTEHIKSRSEESLDNTEIKELD